MKKNHTFWRVNYIAQNNSGNISILLYKSKQYTNKSLSTWKSASLETEADKTTVRR